MCRFWEVSFLKNKNSLCDAVLPQSCNLLIWQIRSKQLNLREQMGYTPNNLANSKALRSHPNEILN
jgi:hypothetical protein